MSEFVENAKGVHLMLGEYTLCGDAFDAPLSEADWDEGPFEATSKTTVTCPDCAQIIFECRAVKFRRRNP
jgi:hypothetical protein